jgi:transposase
MIDMMKRHEIQDLRRAGHTLAETANFAGVSQSSVQRVEAESVVVDIDTAAERARRGVGRPSKAEPFRGRLAAELATEPALLGVELLRRMRLAGYGGGKSALCELVKELRPKTVRPMVRFEGLPGEFSQHDFGQVDVRFVDGTKRRVHFFASRLKYSRFVRVSLVRDERVESLVRPLVDHFEAMGGVPLLGVFDRPKTVAIAWDREGRVTQWNATFMGVVFDLSLGVELCWPYSPEKKGAVENLVGWVKGSFFKQRRFVDEDDLERQLAEWLVEVNTLVPRVPRA